MIIITNKEIQRAREEDVQVAFDSNCKAKPDDKTIVISQEHLLIRGDFGDKLSYEVFVTYACYVGTSCIGTEMVKIQTVPGFFGIKPRPTWFGQFRRRRAFRRALKALS